MLQPAAYALVTASTYALVAMGLVLILRTARFFNFAHGATVTAGAYLAFLCQAQLAFSSGFALVLAAVGGGLLGALTELSVFGPLRRKKAPPLVLFLCSLGVYVVLQNVVSMVWGDQVRTTRQSAFQGARELFGIRVTGVQLLTVIAAGVLSALTALALYRTSIGKAARAVANDCELSSAMGLRSDRVVFTVFVFASALAALAGALMALDLSVAPTMGMSPLMAGMVVVVVGGRGWVLGVLWASLGLGFAQAFVVWQFGSRWQDGMALFILLGVVLLRPTRLLAN